MRYTKQAKTHLEHLTQWQQRGLIIPDQDRAARYLDRIGYYRLSAYCIPFYKRGSAHQFRSDITFDNILNLYVFDRHLRLLVMDAIERVEVAIRAGISNHMSLTNGKSPFWYHDEKFFKSQFSHKRLLADLERLVEDERRRLKYDEDRLNKRTHLTAEQRESLRDNLRKENFLRHYLCKYEEGPRLPPSWMMMELLSWGQLSNLYAGLNRIDQKSVASNLETHAELLESWLRSLNYIRNLCAHHSRLWNRELGVAIKLPSSDKVRWLKNPVILDRPHINYEVRLYPVLVALQSLLSKLSPSSGWATRLYSLMENYPSIPRARMGMPENWFEDEFWQMAIAAAKPGEVKP